MRFNTLINNQKCKEWNLTLNQGVLFDLINQLSSWATELIVDGKVYYHISRNKVIQQIPLAYSKPDTVYRHFKALLAKDLIEYTKIGNKDLVRLTQKGKTWNDFRASEMNPSKFGNESENSSEMNPTYNTTKEHDTIINNISIKKSDIELAFESFYSQYPKKVAKEPARKAFLKLKPNEIQAALDAVAVYPFSKQIKYVQQPVTWINQKRWNDEFDIKQSRFQNPTTGQDPF